MGMQQEKMYSCWLDYNLNKGKDNWKYEAEVTYSKQGVEDIVVNTAIEELSLFFKEHFNIDLKKSAAEDVTTAKGIVLKLVSSDELKSESYRLKSTSSAVTVEASDGKGMLYGVFNLTYRIRRSLSLENLDITEAPVNELRMINQWDNADGSIERGYAGNSIFYKDNQIVKDKSRLKDYARLLASVGINSVCINNVNVHKYETQFIVSPYLEEVAKLAEVFRAYGIQLLLSVNFAAPMSISNLETADPLDESVKTWWKETAKEIYRQIPDLAGFLVKADSENRPGPFTYGRTHADGANMLAEALEPFGGIVVWRCFVYNCHVDWRDRKTDRARAAYDHFKGLDGQFKDNVILQVKNGPMDFQIREPLSPLFGALKETNEVMEFQITQEYTGQQKHICFLVPMWKECLDFETYAKPEGATVKDIVSGKTYNSVHGGIAGVVNIGDSVCWTGNPMAAANLYGFGRLCWNPELSSKEIADEWCELTLGLDEKVKEVVEGILLNSRKVYEDYTVPLGIGWMVTVHYHYGPNIEGYEYSPWGTYHYADYKGIGVDRTVKTGTGYAGQYFEPNSSMYENVETCPEELLLFFHHIDYDYKLKDGRTLLQYIYDVHFSGVEQVEKFQADWASLKGLVEESFFETVTKGLEVQLHDAIEWRDVVNTYFYRKTGIADAYGRTIY